MERDDVLWQLLHPPERARPCPPSKAAPTLRVDILLQVPCCHPAVGVQLPPALQRTWGAGSPLGSYRFFRCWMLPRHLSRPFTMMARRVQSASHSSMLGRQGRLQQGGMGGQCHGPTTRDGRRQQRVSWVPSALRVPAECHPLGTKEPPPTPAAPHMPRGIMRAARSLPRTCGM